MLGPGGGNRLDAQLRKVARSYGDKYYNYNYDVVQKKKIGENCFCKWECFEAVSKKTMAALFKKYYRLADYYKQTEFLSDMMTHEPAQRGRKKMRTTYRVNNTTVCRKAFQSIFGLTNGRLTVAREKSLQNMFWDMRGRARKPKPKKKKNKGRRESGRRGRPRKMKYGTRAQRYKLIHHKVYNSDLKRKGAVSGDE